MILRRTSLPAMLLCLLIPSIGVSQVLPPTPTDGLTLPYESVSAQDDAGAVEVNPAGLAFMDSVEVGYGFEIPSDSLREIERSSQSFLMGYGNGYFGLGFGAQFLERPNLGRDLDSYRKYTLGIALGLPRTFSVGLNANWFGSDYDERLNDLVAWDLGMQWRLGKYLALGAMFRDINAPFLYADEALPRRISAGLTLRLFDGRLMFDNTFEWITQSDAWVWTPRVFTEPVSGVRVFGSASLGIDETAGGALDFDQIWAGVEIALSSVGMAYAPVFAKNLDGKFDYRRLSAYHWVSPNKTRGLFGESGRWIRIDLNQSIDEAGRRLGFLGPRSRSFLSVLDELDRVSRDEDVEGIVMIGGGSQLGYGQSWELRQAIDRVRDAGKKTIFYLTSAGLKDYYVATAAETIWAYPTEPFAPSGVQIRLSSYKGTLNKIGIEAEFLKIGAYKSAPETIVYDGPSKESIEQTTAVADDLYTNVLGAIASGRGKKVEEIEAILADAPHYPTEAMDKGIFDAVLYPDELQAKLAAFVGRTVVLEPGLSNRETREDRWGRKDEVAVLVIDGTIVGGTAGISPFSTTATGGESVRRACESLANNSAVKAVVVRINSPGGSAIASDQIFRSLRLLAKSKPVVASMANVAASGGYYSAVGANEIFATPNTITGSIGIFTGRFNAAGLFNWLNIRGGEKIVRGPEKADFFETWTKEERERTSLGMLYRYRTFLEQVASTRPLSVAEVDAVARGRVWMGSAALERKLVDKRGGLMDAIRRAEQLAGIPHGSATYPLYPQQSLGFGVGAEAGTWLKVGEFFGLIPSEDVELVKQASALHNLIERFQVGMLLPLFFNSDEELMMLYDDLVID